MPQDTVDETGSLEEPMKIGETVPIAEILANDGYIYLTLGSPPEHFLKCDRIRHWALERQPHGYWIIRGAPEKFDPNQKVVLIERWSAPDTS
ncbi:MAG: hypothetical protein WA021_04635 [Minisyncoccia bacterium]